MHRTLIKAIGCMTGVIDFRQKHQLPSKRSHLVKPLMVCLVFQLNKEIDIKKSLAKNVTHLMVD